VGVIETGHGSGVWRTAEGLAVEQPINETTGLPSNAAAVDGGHFLGIPYGWPLALAIIAVILLMWMGREPLRRVLWQIFFITGRVFGRWGVFLLDHGRRARSVTNEKIAAHRADELQDRMLSLEERMGHRAQKLAQETGPMLKKLDKATHGLATSANQLADINLEDAAERAFRAALPSMESTRGLTKIEKSIAQNTARTMNERLAPLRPALTTLRNEAPRLKEVAEKLQTIHHEHTKNTDDVNKAFTEFEEIVRSEDRKKIAAHASIVIPWFIAVLITSIALAGVFLNFFLIERPMSEIVGEGARIGGVGLPAFAAIIVIFLEFVTGVILMDSAGFTKLIPAFHSMSRNGKRVMLIVSFSFLALFSVMEMTLAVVREQIIEQDQEISNIASGALISPNLTRPAPSADAPAQIPERKELPGIFGLHFSTFAQLILAAIIPWLLAAAALPLETIVRNTVFMLSIASSFLLIGLSFTCKTIAVALKNIGLFLLTVYDLIIFVPLWIQRRVQGTARSRRYDAGGNDDLMVLDKKSTQPQKPPKRDRERNTTQPELEKAS